MRINMSKREIKMREKEQKERRELIGALKKIEKIVELGKAIDVKKIEKLLTKLRAEEKLEELREAYPRFQK